MKRILFIVTDNKGEKIKKETKDSIVANLGKEDAYVFIKCEDNDHSEIYCDLKLAANKIINDVNNFDYVCLIPNGSELNASSSNIFKEHQKDRDDDVKEVYLPLALYVDGDTTVIMNKHIWNSMVADEAGVLDFSLAMKQIDSTIFGAFIPTSLFFNENFYDKEIKYYQQYHFLNNLADTNLVLGIPKILVTVGDWDFKMAGLSDEEKIKYFTMARSKWEKSKQPADVVEKN